MRRMPTIDSLATLRSLYPSARSRALGKPQICRSRLRAGPGWR